MNSKLWVYNGVQRCGLHRPKLHGLPQGPEKQPVLQDLCRKRCTKMPRWKGSSNVSSSLWYFDIFWLCQSDDLCQQPSVIQEYKWSNQKKHVKQLPCHKLQIESHDQNNRTLRFRGNLYFLIMHPHSNCQATSTTKSSCESQRPSFYSWTDSNHFVSLCICWFFVAQQILSPCLSPIPSQCPQRPEPLLSFELSTKDCDKRFCKHMSWPWGPGY